MVSSYIGGQIVEWSFGRNDLKIPALGTGGGQAYYKLKMDDEARKSFLPGIFW